MSTNTNATSTTAAPAPQPTADPWQVRPAGNEPLPPKKWYVATFNSVEPYSNEDKGIKDRWKWTWTVSKGEHAGKRASALTDQSIKATTLPGRLIAGMAGRALKDGENVKSLVDGFVGQTFQVYVDAGPKGGRAGVQSATLPPE